MLYKIAKKIRAVKRERGIKSCLNLLALKISNRLELSRVYGLPKHAQVEVTTHCNSSCPMCSRTAQYNSKFRKKPKHMSFQDFKKTVLKLPYCEYIQLQGLGEPLLNPDLVKMVRFCKKNEIVTRLTTNASLLSEKLSKELILNGLGRICFSIDAADAKAFEKIRGGIKFSTVIQNIKKFVELKSRLKSRGLFVEGWVLVFKENLHEIPKILDLVKSLGIRHVTLRTMIEASAWPTPIEVSPKNQHILNKYKSYGRNLGLNVHIIFPHLATERKRKRIRCWMLWKSVYVTVDGGILPCCLFTSGRIATYGNILNQDFKEIWNNAMYQSSRKRLKNGNFDHVCRLCAWKK